MFLVTCCRPQREYQNAHLQLDGPRRRQLLDIVVGAVPEHHAQRRQRLAQQQRARLRRGAALALRARVARAVAR